MNKFVNFKRLLLICLCVFSVSFTWAQKNIRGVIKDVQGNPLVGVNIVEKGTTNGTFTDVDGQFSIQPRTDNAVLEVSYIGFLTQEVESRENMEIILHEDALSLDEIVVIGYGTARRRDLVGSVSHIDGNVLAEKSNMNIGRSIQGQIPGLTISMTDGKPTRGGAINLRGISTIASTGGGALILVDGVEAHGDWSTVNPADIASISVLKDASSAAIYGAKGAFGVILITTKTAGKGKPKVNYNGSASYHRRLFLPDIVTNGLQWTNAWYESYVGGLSSNPTGINNVWAWNDGWYQELVRRDADPALEKVRVNSSGRYEYFGNTDWFDIIYKGHSLSTEHNINISGGSDQVSYYVSGRYFNQDGIYNAGNEDYTQYNLRAKGFIQLNKYITVENNMDFMRRSVHQPMVMYDRQNIMRQLEQEGYPVAFPKNPDGTWTEMGVYLGWAGFVEGTSWQHDNQFDLKNTTVLTIDPIESLTFKADFSYYFSQATRDRAENMYEFYTGPAIKGIRNTFDSSEDYSYNNTYYSSNITANFKPKFNNDAHRLDILAGWNIEHKYTKDVRAYARNLIYPEKPSLALTDNTYHVVGQGGAEWSYAGLLYRVNYIFKDRYLIELSGRYDGTSKFPENQKWGFFPSASLGWRISEEGFMSATGTWLDNLKIRFSAGSLGNGTVDPFQYIASMNVARTAAIIGDGLQAYTYAPNNIPTSLTWETNTTYDVGLDLDILKNRLSFTGDYFWRYTTDMLTPGVELPAVFGASMPLGNNADMKTLGWELSLQWRDYFNLAGKDFNYSMRAMIWDNQSWITRVLNNENKVLGTGQTPNYYVGMKIGEVWGYHIEGLFRSYEDIANHANQSAIVVSTENIIRPGDLKYADLDGNNIINSGSNTVDDPGDRRIIGNISSRYNYGFNMSANWNGFGISAFIQGIGKKNWYPRPESGTFWGHYNRPYGFYLKIHTGDNVWREENQNFDAYWPRYRAYLATSSNRSMTTVNDRYLQNVAYARLKNLQLDYSFNRQVCDFLHVSDLRVYLAGENLYTWSPLFKVNPNYDPEMINPGDPDFRAVAGTDGDGYGYPFHAVYTFGINITF